MTAYCTKQLLTSVDNSTSYKSPAAQPDHLAVAGVLGCSISKDPVVRIAVTGVDGIHRKSNSARLPSGEL